jgi:catechol 2,3-dioxygenase-like lactoylglutathione lyase family enzyme
MRIKMCSIHVHDPAEAYEIYTGTLGFTEVLAVPDAELFIVAAPGSPGVGLLLEPSDNPVAEHYRSTLYADGLPAIVLGVPDVRAEVDRLRALGVGFHGDVVEDPSGTSALFDDGCGNYVQLHEDTA